MEYGTELRTCLKCGHSWKPRTTVYPKRCTKCMSAFWDGRQRDFSHQRFKAKRQTDALIGRKFGKLEVIGHHSRRKGYNCICQCGNYTIARSDDLKNGTRTSCGCWYKNSKSVADFAKYTIFWSYFNSAGERNLSFTLSEDELCELISSSCHYCGTFGGNTFKKGTKKEYKYNGIDRIDNSIGYDIANCVPCCWQCNQAKYKYSEHDFFDWLKRVYNGTWYNEKIK